MTRRQRTFIGGAALLIAGGLLGRSAEAATPVDPTTAAVVEAFLRTYLAYALAQSPSYYDLYSDRALIYVRANSQEPARVFQGRNFKGWGRELLETHRLLIDASLLADATVEEGGGRLRVRARRYSRARCFWDTDYQLVVERELGNLRIVEERVTTRPDAHCEVSLVAPALVSPGLSYAALGDGASSSPPRWRPLSQVELEQSALRLAQEAATHQPAAANSPAAHVPQSPVGSAAGQSAATDDLLVTPR